MEYVLQTVGLTKRYRHFKALDGLTMSVPRGSIYGLVGRNGAGKTTLIRLICGLQAPTAGAYALYGRKHTDKDIDRSRRRMGPWSTPDRISRPMPRRCGRPGRRGCWVMPR